MTNQSFEIGPLFDGMSQEEIQELVQLAVKKRAGQQVGPSQAERQNGKAEAAHDKSQADLQASFEAEKAALRSRGFAYVEQVQALAGRYERQGLGAEFVAPVLLSDEKRQTLINEFDERRAGLRSRGVNYTRDLFSLRRAYQEKGLSLEDLNHD